MKQRAFINKSNDGELIMYSLYQTNETLHDQTAIKLQQILYIYICIYIQQIADFIIKLSLYKFYFLWLSIFFHFMPLK